MRSFVTDPIYGQIGTVLMIRVNTLDTLGIYLTPDKVLWINRVDTKGWFTNGYSYTDLSDLRGTIKLVIL